MYPTESQDGPVPLLDDAAIAEVLRAARRIAVVGASSNPARPSNGVFRTLVAAGYDCVPVNPNEAMVEGVAAVATLAEAAEALGGPIDIVDVFRRSELTEEIAREAVAVGARVLWLQLGIVNEAAARIAAEGGLAIVMDRCTAIEIRRVARRRVRPCNPGRDPARRAPPSSGTRRPVETHDAVPEDGVVRAAWGCSGS